MTDSIFPTSEDLNLRVEYLLVTILSDFIELYFYACRENAAENIYIYFWEIPQER